MNQIADETAANRAAQLRYLAEDRELVDVIWKISALPEDARLIVRLMVSHLLAAEQARRAA